MILIDPPNAAGHGRLWSHLASDTSLAELHAFAEGLGFSRRGFDRDHYDVPAEWYDDVVAARPAVRVTAPLSARAWATGKSPRWVRRHRGTRFRCTG